MSPPVAGEPGDDRRMIRAVLFDLDGVIRHFFPDYVADVEFRHGLKPGSIEAFAFSHPLIDYVTSGRITRAAWVAAIAEHLACPAAADEWEKQPYRCDEEVLELASRLRAGGVVTAILTNGTDATAAELAELGIHERFDWIFNSADIGYPKPDRRAFQHVLDVLRLPGSSVFFTDDSPAKLAGAVDLGMRTHRFTDAASLRRALLDHGVRVGTPGDAGDAAQD